MLTACFIQNHNMNNLELSELWNIRALLTFGQKLKESNNLKEKIKQIRLLLFGYFIDVVAEIWCIPLEITVVHQLTEWRVGHVTKMN